MISIKNVASIALSSMLFAVPAIAAAQSATPQVHPPQNAIVVATVNIYNAQIASQSGDTIHLTFDLSNRVQVQPDVRYSVRLISQDGQQVTDEKVYDDVVNLGENQTISKSIDYTAPKYFNGTFQVWILARNENGLLLALVNPGKITLKGDSQFVELSSCFFRVDGEPATKVYSLTQGVDIKTSEKLIINCSATNHTSAAVSVTPSFATTYRTAFGNAVQVAPVSQPAATIKSQENKQLSFVVPKPADPQAYDGVLELFDSHNKSVSNKIVFHYVLRGLSATIQNLRLDKDAYQKGDTARVSFFWSASADDFPGSRLGATDNASTSTFALVVSVADKSGNACGSIAETLKGNSGIQTYDMPISADCMNPRVSVAVKSAAGAVLDSKNFSIESRTVLPHRGLGIGWWIGIAAALLALAIGGWLALKSRNKNVIMTLAFIMLSGASLMAGGAKAKADTWTLSPDKSIVSSLVFTGSLDKAATDPYAYGHNVTASGSVSSVWCSNAVANFTENVYINGTLGIILNNTGVSVSGAQYNSIGSVSIAAPLPGSYNASFYVGYNYSSIHAAAVSGFGFYSIPYTVAPFPTITVYRYPSIIWEGQSMTNWWRTTNATSVYMYCTGPGGLIRASGEALNNGPVTSTWSDLWQNWNGQNFCTWTATGPGGSIQYQETFAIVHKPTITVYRTPTTLTQGQSMTNSWTSTNATAVLFDCNPRNPNEPYPDWENIGINGPFTKTWDQMWADGWHGAYSCTMSALIYGVVGDTVADNFTIVPPTPAPTASLLVNGSSSATVTTGTRATLTWSSTNATSCTAGGPWSNGGLLSGSGLTNPITTTTTFTFQCTGAGGTSPAQSVTVYVNPGAATCPAGTVGTCVLPSGTYGAGNTPGTCVSGMIGACQAICNATGTWVLTNNSCVASGPHSVTFTATPSSITAGQSSRLDWNAPGADSCVWQSGVGPSFGTGGFPSGNVSVWPSTTSTYYLVCAWGASLVNTQATVNVTAPVGCSATTVSNCSLPASATNAIPFGTCVNGSTGSCRYQCNGGNSWTNYQAMTCTMPCPVHTGTVSWQSGGNTCSTNASFSEQSGANSAVVSNTAPGYAGSATYWCSNGSWLTAPTNVSCSNVAPTVTISAFPTRVQSGGHAHLTWSSVNATTCTVTGTNGFSQAGTSGTSVDAGAITYQTKFTASCDSGAATADVIVNIVPKYSEF